MKRQLYMAYGSNLNRTQMQWRCPGAKIICKSWLHDYRLVFQGARFGSHANVIPAKGFSVPVLLWEITPRDEAILDRYEGVKGGYYTKEYMTVECNGEMKDALVYIMKPSGYGFPADHYLQIIVDGYQQLNFPIGDLHEALVYSNQNMEEDNHAG